MAPLCLMLYQAGDGNASYQALIAKYERRMGVAVRAWIPIPSGWLGKYGNRRLDRDGDHRLRHRATGEPEGAEPDRQPLHHPLPNRICDGRNERLSDHIRDNGFLWYDTTCFKMPAVGYFGNSGPTVLNGPGMNNWDLGVQKSFHSGGREPLF